MGSSLLSTVYPEGRHAERVSKYRPRWNKIDWSKLLIQKKTLQLREF